MGAAYPSAVQADARAERSARVQARLHSPDLLLHERRLISVVVWGPIKHEAC